MSAPIARLRILLFTLLACALLQCAIFTQLLRHGPGGKLIACLLPPCQQQWPLWLTLALFAFIACTTARTISTLASAPHHATPGNSALVGTVGVALVNFAIDVFYAHPIPHGGVSLNMLMHSNIATTEQALLPLFSVVLSAAVMGLNVISHRALVDLSESHQASKKAT
jgi:hypothetical protein